MYDAPTWDPELFDPENCEHEALPDTYSLCGTCGWRKWLTTKERDYLLRQPWTQEIREEIRRGGAYPGKYMT